MQKYILLLSLIVTTVVSAQRDTAFWFAVPEADATHADRPIILRLTSFEDSTDVRISLPADSSFHAIEFTMGEDELRSEDLTDYIDLLECKHADSILNNGLFIESSRPIRAIYDLVASDGSGWGAQNSDFFTLKGNYALGTNFYLPFQNVQRRAVEKASKAQTAFDIVATEDSTTITITPKGELVGHAANEPFKVVLMKGQTYSGVMKNNGTDFLTGTNVSSDKPIAMTMKDDSVYFGETGTTGWGWDLLGDQVIPAQYSGYEFIVQDGFLIVVAQEDATTVSDVNGVVASLDVGESVTIEVGLAFPEYFFFDKPVSVLHVKPMDIDRTEPGAVSMGGITCNGLREVSFYPYASDRLVIILLTRKGAETGFFYNGEPAGIGDGFVAVEGTEDWLYLEYSPAEGEFYRGEMNTISNNKGFFDFAFGMGGYQSQYGFISDGNLEIFEEDTVLICDTDTNRIEAPVGFEYYTWSDGSDQRFVDVIHDTTKYGIEVIEDAIGACVLTDTVTVIIEESPAVDLGEDRGFCEGEIFTLGQEMVADHRYVWNTGDSVSIIQILEDGLYTLQISSPNGCVSTDSVTINHVDLPELSLSSDTTLCSEETVMVVNSNPDEKLYWTDLDAVMNAREIVSSGNYTVRAYSETQDSVCAEIYETIDVTFWNVEVYNVLSPNGDDKNEVFEVEGIDKGIWDFKVYNRWGQVVYTDEIYDNTWDGGDLSNGVYFYELNESSVCNEFHGWVELIR